MGNVLGASIASRLGLATDLVDPVQRAANGAAAFDVATRRPSAHERDIALRELGLPAEMASLIPDGVPPFATVRSLLDASRLFDRDFYLAQEPPGLANNDPCVHYLGRGWRDGFSPNFYVDSAFYLAQDGIRGAEAVNPLFHYLYVGEAAGLRPSPHFEPEWYRKRYGPIGQSPLCHYLRHMREHRFSPNPDFDVAFYLRAYPDVGEICDDPFYHFALYGRREGRRPRARPQAALPDGSHGGRDLESEIGTILDSKLFDASWYRRHANQAAADEADLVSHYLTASGRDRPNPHPLFDTSLYASRHEDEIGGVDPFVHYIREGWRRGFDPHPLFSVAFYLEKYDDVREVGCEPLWHYLAFGWREGRRPCAEFDTSHYLETNADVRAQGVDPLTHYLEHGAAEGRNPSPGFDTRWYASRVLEGAAVNPLAHFRASGSDPDVLVKSIPLSKRYEMSNDDLERWTRWFRDRDTPSSVVDLDRIDAAGLGAAIARSRAGCDGGRRAFLLCDPSDTADDDLLPHLAEAMTKAELCVFDLVYERDGAWAPVLLPGANAVHLEAVDASFSRFAISSTLLARLDVDPMAKAHDVLKTALAQLRAENRLDLFAHTAMPIVRARDLSQALCDTRRGLALAAHVGVRSRSLPADQSSVSVVICSKDRCRLLSQLLDALLAKPSSLVRDIVVVTNATTDSYAAQVQAHYAGETRIEILRHDGPYNFSQQSNDGAARCSGDLLLFLNDDIVPIVPHWLETLRAPFEGREVGVTGPLLFYPDERSQHVGLYLGYRGSAGHGLRGARVPDEDYMLMASAPRNVSAVTGAALLTRRALFEDLNGFDRHLGTYLQDVDYCLRVRNSDREIVFEPRSLLFHMESVSMRETPEAPVFGDRRPLEHRHFVRRWGHALFDDPFHNPNFELEDESLRTIVRGAL